MKIRPNRSLPPTLAAVSRLPFTRLFPCSRFVRVPAVLAALCLAPAAGLAQTGTCTITQQPADQTVCADIGGANQFTLTASISDASTWVLWQLPFAGGARVAIDSSDKSVTTATETLYAYSTNQSGFYYFEFSRPVFPQCVTDTRSAKVQVLPAGPQSQSSPVSQTVCQGDTATLAATATSDSTGVTYFWTKNGGTMSDTSRITGTSGTGLTATLTITNVHDSDAASYAVSWSTANCGMTSQSQPASLTVDDALVVDTQPADTISCVGGTVALSCHASYTEHPPGSSLEPSYQWQKQAGNGNWSNRAGATNSLLTIGPLAAGDAGYYRCKLTSPACGVAYSDSAQVILGAPGIVTQPTSVAACPGSAATFSIVANNTNASTTYQWFKAVNGTFKNPGGTNVSGKLTSTLTISNVGSTDATNYICTLNNPADVGGCNNSTDSVVVTLTVSPDPPTIVSNPAAVTVPAGGTAMFTVVASSSDLTYQWRNGNNVLINDGVLANGTVVSGATTPTLVLSSINPADVAHFYHAVVGNECGSATSSASALTVNGCPFISMPPSDVLICSGTPTNFSLTALGTPPPTYQWRLNGTNVPGATNATIEFDSPGAGDVGTYDCLLSNCLRFCGQRSGDPDPERRGHHPTAEPVVRLRRSQPSSRDSTSPPQTAWRR